MFENFEDMIFFVVGVLSAVISAFTRAIRKASCFTKLGFFQALSDAVTCALISAGVGFALHEYLQLDYGYMILIGTFIGSMGSTYITGIIDGLIKTYLSINKRKASAVQVENKEGK